jgi:hypothetical protein
MTLKQCKRIAWLMFGIEMLLTVYPDLDLGLIVQTSGTGDLGTGMVLGVLEVAIILLFLMGSRVWWLYRLAALIMLIQVLLFAGLDRLFGLETPVLINHPLSLCVWALVLVIHSFSEREFPDMSAGS